MVQDSKAETVTADQQPKNYKRRYVNPFFLEETQEEQKKYHKLYQPYWLYFAVIICQIMTLFLSLLLLMVSLEKRSTVYLIYIIFSCVRCAVWIYNSIYLIGFSKSLFRLYFLIDNNLLFFLGTSITYLAYNFGNSIKYKQGAMVCYPILVFIMTGNYRVMLAYCKWDRWQFITYKLVKLIAAMFNLVYGVYATKQTTLYESDLFLLYIFTTFSYSCQLYFGMNRLDQSDTLIPDYEAQDTIDSQRLVVKKLIQKNQALS